MTTPYQRKDHDSVSADVVWHNSTVTHADRVALKQQRSVCLWFTGLSGSGKSTVANAVESKLLQMGKHSYLLDGDNVRHGLNKDLGFSDTDRIENIRRVGEVAKLFVDAGNIVLTAFISPFNVDRQRVRMMVEDEGDFIEIYCRCPLSVCEDRDVKGLYQRARKGEIVNFTGISSPYEEPQNADLVVDTDKLSLDACVDKVIQLLRSRCMINF